jgi:hypothetical protein
LRGLSASSNQGKLIIVLPGKKNEFRAARAFAALNSFFFPGGATRK